MQGEIQKPRPQAKAAGQPGRQDREPPRRRDRTISNALASRSALTSISRSWRSCTRSQSRSCSEGLSSTHQKSDAGSIASVLLTLQAAGSITFSTAHRGSSSGAPAARNARRDPSRNPGRHRIDSQRHQNRDVAHSRKSIQPGASCPLQHDDEAEGPAAVIGIDPAGERGDPGADAPVGNQQQEALGVVRHGFVRHCPVRICALTLSRGAGGAWARNIASASLAVRDNGGVAARSAEPPLRAQGAFLCLVHPAAPCEATHIPLKYSPPSLRIRN